MAKLIYPELSYKVTGVMFVVHNALGPTYAEKHYQQALEKAFKAEKLEFIAQADIPLYYKDSRQKIGYFKADFLIDDKLVLEIKTVRQITYDHCRQLMRYLKQTNYQLGIIANFRRQRLETKRIINVLN